MSRQIYYNTKPFLPLAVLNVFFLSSSGLGKLSFWEDKTLFDGF